MTPFHLAALLCWIFHAGHAYGDRRHKGSKGAYKPYRICQRCGWVQMEEDT